MVDDERQDAPQDEQPPEHEPAAEEAAEQPQVAEEPAAEEPAAEEPAAEEPAAEEPAPEPQAAAEDEPSEEPPAAEQPRPKPKRRQDAKADEPEVIPGAHLEPDLVLEEERRTGDDAEVDRYATEADAELVASAEGDTGEGEPEPEAPQPLTSTVLELAADARYHATGKRKSAIARVILRPGTGQYTVNGRSLQEHFPRATLQTQARRPLETVGQQERMDVIATIHGGGVSAQAGALRHGITRALVEADPNLRGELKRRGFLTRDPRVKERKKAGLKKARKRPQFSKR
jgi:small subunit ribosomal protein S9